MPLPTRGIGEHKKASPASSQVSEGATSVVEAPSNSHAATGPNESQGGQTADDPGVISQFGGVRPPFMRVQPKLKLDVEL